MKDLYVTAKKGGMKMENEYNKNLLQILLTPATFILVVNKPFYAFSKKKINL